MSQPETGAAGTAPTGFYGKLPSLGDFVTRRLPAQFVQPWDLWLREAMAASQAQLAQDWLDHYLTSPLWRFVLSPGLAGQDGWAGVLMPSVDRVGRYFPLTLARPLSPGANPYRTLCRPDWFERAESVALSGLDDAFDLDAFETRGLALESPEPSLEPSVASPSDASAHRAERGGDAWQMGVASPAQLQDACPVLLEQALGELFFAYSLWSTSGSERVAPSLLACQGLPNPAGFAALLAGDWGGRGWVRLGPA
jgi:type VI secretion system protein ImpM